MYPEHFFAWEGFTRVVQGLLRLRSVKSEESPGCGTAEEQDPRATTVRRTKFASKLPILRRPMDTVGRPPARVDRTHWAGHLRPVCQELGAHLVDVRDLKI